MTASELNKGRLRGWEGGALVAKTLVGCDAKWILYLRAKQGMLPASGAALMNQKGRQRGGLSEIRSGVFDQTAIAAALFFVRR